MKKLSEEDITRLIAEQLTEDKVHGATPDGGDEELYQVLFTALADEPFAPANPNLANAVVQQINLEEQKAEARRYVMAIAAVIIVGILISYISINYISPDFLSSIANLVLPYKWIILFVIACFSLIEIADKNLVKRKLVEVD